jgi:hypothetical protein
MYSTTKYLEALVDSESPIVQDYLFGRGVSGSQGLERVPYHLYDIQWN